jgi:hypothetical protein
MKVGTWAWWDRFWLIVALVIAAAAIVIEFLNPTPAKHAAEGEHQLRPSSPPPLLAARIRVLLGGPNALRVRQKATTRE